MIRFKFPGLYFDVRLKFGVPEILSSFFGDEKTDLLARAGARV
jgi:hypothetical protein